MSTGLFITGTGTGVGKTYVGALIASALRASGKRVGVYKPVASGCEIVAGNLVSPDANALWQAAGRPGSLEHVCPQVFAAPIAPHLAARAEGKRVDKRLLRDGLQFWRANSDVVIVEGAGGLMSPISDDDYNADLAVEFGFPLLIVAANVLGTIKATLQTLITANSSPYNLGVAGIVLNSLNQPANDPSVESNADEIAGRCEPPLLATVEHGGTFDRPVDWWALTKGLTA
jgi:dethiobiotin synthetase